MATREDIVVEARTWLGTPWKHQARLKGVGVDCLGLIVKVGHELGLIDSSIDRTDYTRNPKSGEMRDALESNLDYITTPELGCVVWMRYDLYPRHLAIIVGMDEPLRILHAVNIPGIMKCVEHDMNAVWWPRVSQYYRYRGLE